MYRQHDRVPEELLDYPIAGVRATIVRAGRTAAETPGSARLLEEDELYLDKLLHTAAASPPPAAPGDGPAHRTVS